MSAILGTNVAAPVVPFTTDDQYATHIDKYGAGGWRAVDNMTALAAIPTTRLVDGMAVLVRDSNLIYVFDAPTNQFVSFGGLAGFITTLGFSLWTDLSGYIAANPTNTLIDGTTARVIGDAGTHNDDVTGTSVNNEGIYRLIKATSKWQRIGDLETVDLVSATQSLVDEATDARDEVVDKFNSLNFQVLDPAISIEPTTGKGCIFGIGDLDTNRYAILVLEDGQVIIGDMAITSQIIGLSNLKPEVTGLMFVELDPTQYSEPSTGEGLVAAIIDPVTNRYAFAVTASGNVIIPKLLNAVNDLTGKVTIAALADETTRFVAPIPTDVVAVEPDDWRGKPGAVPLRSPTDGTFWAAILGQKSFHMRGINTTAASLSFRRSNRLPVRGKRYQGGFDASGQAATNLRGSFTTTLPTTTGAATGDYWQFWNVTTNYSLGGFTLNLGDLLVWNGTALVQQKAPIATNGAGYRNRLNDDFWVVTSSGTFDGVFYDVGDRITYLGFKSQSGTGCAKWTKGNNAGKGDLFYRGEFDASTGSMPLSPINGDLYQVSVAGTAGSIAWSVSDYAIYENGAWGRVASDTILTFASGSYINLPCISGDTSEWEFRRTDKSNTRVYMQIGVRHLMLQRRHVNKLFLRSDSMFGVNNVGGLIIAGDGRTGSFISDGGATSDDVRAMVHDEIMNLNDPYAGFIRLFWHGQNNQPSVVGDANWTMITEASIDMAKLIGARDGRFAFMSVLGQHAMTWNGTRLVNGQLEDQFNKTGALYNLRLWYDQMFPGLHIWPGTYLLADASANGGARPELQFPGMTEKQVADTYGIVPLRYYLDWSQYLPADVQANPGTYNFTGYHSADGLPTGGTAKDYKIRTGGNSATTGTASVGALLFNIGGSWQEPTRDMTHMSNIGAPVLGTGIGNWLKTHF